MKEKVLKARVKSSFLSLVYTWMVVALCISAAAAWWGAKCIELRTGPLYPLLSTSQGCITLAVAEIAIVFALSLLIKKMSAFMAVFMFILYSLVNGLTLCAIFLLYTKESIMQVFFISAAMFGSMAIYGSVTKSSLMSVGKYLSMALIGIFIAMIVNFFMHSSRLSTLISIITVVVFTGLTAYDAQKLSNINKRIGGASAQMIAKASIIGALELYLDFINVFLNLLRLFGRQKD